MEGETESEREREREKQIEKEKRTESGLGDQYHGDTLKEQRSHIDGAIQRR